MTDEQRHEEADNLVGVPEPHPAKGGPNADPNVPDPSDLVPPISGPPSQEAVEKIQSESQGD